MAVCGQVAGGWRQGELAGEGRKDRAVGDLLQLGVEGIAAAVGRFAGDGARRIPPGIADRIPVEAICSGLRAEDQGGERIDDVFQDVAFGLALGAQDALGFAP